MKKAAPSSKKPMRIWSDTVPVYVGSPKAGPSRLRPATPPPLPSAPEIMREFDGRILGLERHIRENDHMTEMERCLKELEEKVAALEARNAVLEDRTSNVVAQESDLRSRHIEAMRIITEHADNLTLAHQRYWFLNDRINEALDEDLEFEETPEGNEEDGSDVDGEGDVDDSNAGEEKSGTDGEAGEDTLAIKGDVAHEKADTVEQQPSPGDAQRESRDESGPAVSGAIDPDPAPEAQKPAPTTASEISPSGNPPSVPNDPTLDPGTSVTPLLEIAQVALETDEPDHDGDPPDRARPSPVPERAASPPIVIPECGPSSSAVVAPPAVAIIPPTPSSSLEQSTGTLMPPQPPVNSSAIIRRRSPRYRSPPLANASRGATPHSGEDGPKPAKRKASDEPGPGHKKSK